MFTVQCTISQLEALKRQLSDAGSVITVPDNTLGKCEISGNGITANWTHNGTDTLCVNVRRKPVFVSEGYIRNRLIDRISEQEKETKI